MRRFWNRYRELLLYAFFGVCTFLIDSGGFFLLSRCFDLQKSTWLLHLCSVSCTLAAITFAYFTNRRFVFLSGQTGAYAVLHEAFQFYAARLFTLILAEVLLELTVMHLGLTDWLMKLSVNLLVILLNYIFSKFWIFRTPQKPAEKGAELRMKRLCVFDLDGTLVDTIADIADAMNRSLAEMGKQQYSLADYRQMVGNGMARLCRRALPDGTEEEQRELLERYRTRYLAHCCEQSRPYPGICAVLQRLHARGVLLAVLSNKPQAQTERVVADLLGEIPFFAVMGQSEAFPIKPDPASLRFLMKEAGVTEDAVCYVGDSEVDIQLGANADVDSIGAAWGFRGETALRKAGAVTLAHTAEELGEMLLAGLHEA